MSNCCIWPKTAEPPNSGWRRPGHGQTRFEEVTADELCADVVEGRAVA
ncbi:hypothetical protein PY32053_04602 (plasmid) [Paracoccus yeei]|uniref:Uncharacterized protein n=1 Tax=Paracoccus yeei TaxID=147645 RepID=A0A386UTV4_9RHOB|nr:hypothetical protein PY32053_04602 [Paracoccus yeei]